MKKLQSVVATLTLLGVFAMVQMGTVYGQTDGNTIEFQEKFNQFLEETVDMRQDLASKQTDVQTEMISTNPDRQKIAMLTEEIYQLRDALQVKAQEAGIDTGLRSGGGCGCAGGSNNRI